MKILDISFQKSNFTRGFINENIFFVEDDFVLLIK